MTVQFTALREDILLQVKTEAFLTGEVAKDGSPSDISRATKTQASDEDDYILSKYIDTAASVVVDILTGHLSTATLEQKETQTSKGFPTTEFVFDCEVPSTYDMNQNSSIEEGIKDYMAAYTLYKWYKRVNPNMADPSELDSFESNLNHRINQRTRPVRRPVLPINI